MSNPLLTDSGFGGIEAWEQGPGKHTQEPCELQGGSKVTIPQHSLAIGLYKDSVWLECGWAILA